MVSYLTTHLSPHPSRIRAQFVAGTLNPTEALFPRFLYGSDHVYNEEDIEEGLYRSEFLVRVSVYISF